MRVTSRTASRSYLRRFSALPWVLTQASPTLAASSHSRRLLAAHSAQGSVAGAVVLPAACAVVAVAILLPLTVLWWRRKREKLSFSTGSGQEKKAEGQLGSTPAGNTGRPEEAPILCLTLNDIQVATEGFKPEGLLSDKPYSSVHYAEGPEGELWAVKRAKGVSLHGEHLFRNEVEFLSVVSHPHILPLLGYCNEGGEHILVFEHMSKGTLSSWLRPGPSDAQREPLPFPVRLDIAVGVADALRYLHSFNRPTIIHRDVRSASVLLDTDFAPRLGALGLLKHLPGEGLRLRMAGRKGYLDPEYFQSFKVTTKCDVFSFGVVLFELLTGRVAVLPAARPQSQRPITLAHWAQQAVEEGRAGDIIDPRMPPDQCPPEGLQALARIAAACVAPLRRDRPDMARVTLLLSELRRNPSKPLPGLPATPRLRPGNSRVVPTSS